MIYPPVAELGVSACAVMAEIVHRAFTSWQLMRKKNAREVGREAVKDREKTGAVVARANRQDLNYAFKEIMGEAYRQSYASSRPPDTITLTVSRAALLDGAGLSRNSANYARLDDALHDLRTPVAAARTLRALLVDVKYLNSGSLRLVVNGRWLPGPKRASGIVPVPLPTRGASTLALYLFAAASDQRAGSSTNSIRAKELYRRIRSSSRWPREARAAFTKMLVAVNAHLARLNHVGALAQRELPIRFEDEWLDDGRVRLNAVYGIEQQQEADEMRRQKQQEADDAERRRSRLERADREQEERWLASKRERDRRCGIVAEDEAVEDDAAYQQRLERQRRDANELAAEMRGDEPPKKKPFLRRKRAPFGQFSG